MGWNPPQYKTVKKLDLRRGRVTLGWKRAMSPHYFSIYFFNNLLQTSKAQNRVEVTPLSSTEQEIHAVVKVRNSNSS